MATHDVPGANPQNDDELHAGCWAEHPDGSLIYVKGTENDTIVYEIFDMATKPVTKYTDAMTLKDFERTFSANKQDRKKQKAIGTWTWHDKTPFPWSRVMAMGGRPVPEAVSAVEQVSAAARVAKSLKLRGDALAREQHTHLVDEDVQRGYNVLERVARALGQLTRPNS